MKTQYSLIAAVTMILLPFIILPACGNKHTHDRKDFFWEPIDPEIDSIVRKFDYTISVTHKGHTADSLLKYLSTHALHSDNRSVRARAYYFYSQYYKMTGKRETSYVFLDSALKFADTIGHPYEFARISLFKPMPQPDAAQHYAELQRNCEVLKAVGDSSYVANAYNRIATYHEIIGDHVNAVKFISKGLEWIPLDHNWERFVCTYNLALNYNGAGDSLKCREIIDTMRRNEMRKKIADVDFGIMQLSYRYTDDVADLYEAFDAASQRGMDISKRVTVAALLSMHYIKGGERDSARRYCEIVRVNMEKGMTHYDDMLLASAMLYEADGMTDSAAEMRRQYEEETMRLNDIKTASELANRGTREQIAALEEQLSETRWINPVVAMIIVVALVAVFILLKRRYNDYDRRRLKKRLEEHNRRLSVAEVKIADRKRQMDEIAECLSSIKGPTPPEVARLLSQMKTNTVDEIDWESISLLFAELNPEFKRRLHEKHPELTASYVRLASLIYLGLGTKHIARLLAINPDSVKKSRQRLRAKLGLAPGTDIETYLWELANGKR